MRAYMFIAVRVRVLGCDVVLVAFGTVADLSDTLSKVVNDLEAQWSRHSIIAAQIRTALNAINGFKVVDTSVTPAGPVLGKTSSGITLLTTDHMPYDVAFRGGKSVVEVAAGAGTEAGDNPAGTSACERTTVAA
jgi:hypothetical protein